MEYRICNDKNCQYQGKPQSIGNFSKRPRMKSGLKNICKACTNRKNKKRKEFGEKVRKLSRDDKLTVISCLYVTRKETINKLSKLFDETKETIIKVLKYENLYDYNECKCCGKLKTFSEFNKNQDNNYGIGIYCLDCDSTKKKQFRSNAVLYKSYGPKLEKYDIIRESYDGFLETKCAYCGQWFMPKGMSVIERVKAVNGKLDNNAENRMYCSYQCKEECPIFGKSAEQLMKEDMFRAGKIDPSELNREVQPELRQMVFARDNHTCQKCGKHKSELKCGLHAHHMEGIRWDPLESADIDKCITYCADCHRLVHKIPGCQHHEMRCNAEDMDI